METVHVATNLVFHGLTLKFYVFSVSRKRMVLLYYYYCFSSLFFVYPTSFSLSTLSLSLVLLHFLLVHCLTKLPDFNLGLLKTGLPRNMNKLSRVILSADYICFFWIVNDKLAKR